MRTTLRLLQSSHRVKPSRKVHEMCTGNPRVIRRMLRSLFCINARSKVERCLLNPNWNTAREVRSRYPQRDLPPGRKYDFLISSLSYFFAFTKRRTSNAYGKPKQRRRKGNHTPRGEKLARSDYELCGGDCACKKVINLEIFRMSRACCTAQRRLNVAFIESINQICQIDYRW